MQVSKNRKSCLYSPYAYLKATTFRKETYYMMNHYTLKIKDPEMRCDFENDRSQNFDRLFVPMLLVVICL